METAQMITVISKTDKFNKYFLILVQNFLFVYWHENFMFESKQILLYFYENSIELFNELANLQNKKET